MEPEGSVPNTQVPSNCSYQEPDQSSPCYNRTSLRFILILSFQLRQVLPSGLVPSDFPTNTL